MNCPLCGHGTRVVDSRPSEDGLEIRRRRKCVQCLRSTTSYERYDKPEEAAKIEAAARSRLAALKIGLRRTLKHITDLEEQRGRLSTEATARRIR